MESLGAAIVGCGNIARAYARDLNTYTHIKLVGVTDIDSQRAQEFAKEFNCRAFASVDEILADDSIDVVVNLTIPHVHAEISARCLSAGKHVYSEKPLALTYDDAKRLVELAQQHNVRLGCSPSVFMGEAPQTAWKFVRSGKLGPVRVAYAEVNGGRIESWHPAPGSFYQVGPMFDIGVYPLMLLTAMFGPARLVSAYGRVVYPDRVTLNGTPFHIDTPDFLVTMVELENGTLVRLTANFYVQKQNTKQAGIELHGDQGSLFLSSYQDFNAAVEFSELRKEYETVPYVRQPPERIEWGRGVAEFADAILHDRPHRATGAQAAHIVEILTAVTTSLQNHTPAAVHSSFTPPAPMEWAL
jgi:predicted dehydrogenase